MQMMRTVVVACLVCSASGPTRADDAAVQRRGSDEPKSDDLDLRLTLSSFLFRESGSDAGPIVTDGAPVESASPVRRYFGDLRMELSAEGLTFDGRVRQTTSQRYQAGAGAGGEYEVRALNYRIGSQRTGVILGRQYVDAVGATKIDGGAIVQRLSKVWSGTLFGGAFPALGSRSIDTDYPAINNADGTTGSPMIPLTSGLGITYNTPDVHGDVGLAGVYVAQEVPGATSSEKSRVFTTASGYARPAAALDIYHYALVDVAGGGGVNLVNGSLGINAHPVESVQLSASVNHVSVDLLTIAARNVLTDPDPDAIGIVQNDIAVIRVSQDVVRAGTSVALARSRFEISLSGGFHRRPEVSVALADGSGSKVAFPEARSADATLVVLDRKSLGGVRASASATLTFPIGKDVPNRSRGAIVRLTAMRAFLDSRAELTADVMVERFRDLANASMCADSLNVFACFSTSTTAAGQAGVLGSYRVAREWLVLLDTHVGVQDVDSTSTLMGSVAWPRVYSVTAFARVQWRYR
jgi:hypothetical protein